ncbi:hypothetical protein Bbelb_380150 [Branchiostoma belcheri]|nr:hypothetical protein Bbelb_380150 [Branchiostoma belcheri]
MSGKKGATSCYCVDRICNRCITQLNSVSAASSDGKKITLVQEKNNSVFGVDVDCLVGSSIVSVKTASICPLTTSEKRKSVAIKCHCESGAVTVSITYGVSTKRSWDKRGLLEDSGANPVRLHVCRGTNVRLHQGTGMVSANRRKGRGKEQRSKPVEKKKKNADVTDEILRNVYYDPGNPAGFGGVGRLHQAVGSKHGITRQQVKDWLRSQDTYTLHKPIRRRFKRGRVVVSGLNHQWQADLADLSSLAKHNDGYRYLLTCIDVLSKFAWAVPIKDKKGLTLVEAFQSILDEGRKPWRLQTDQGTEFLNRHFQTLLKNEDIEFFTTFNAETKASVVERFNRTLKTRMWKYFTANNTHRYIDVLDNLLDAYNHSYHRSIKKAPVEVTKKNQRLVWHTLYVYRVTDYDGEELKGTFYEEELQKVSKKDDDEVYQVEKILDTRRRETYIAMANSFYVTLPSDGSMDIFPENTVTNYRTKLAHPIELSGEWEVGLVEIQYPHSWLNVREGENTLLYYVVDEKVRGGNREYEIVKIPIGYYENVLHLVKTLNEAASTRYPDVFKNHDMFAYNSVTKRVTMVLPPMASNATTTTTCLVGPLAKKLGWGGKDAIYGSWVQAPRTPDPNLGFNSLYVYGDVVQHRLVGGVKVPLLRIIKIEGQDGDIVDHPIMTPHYIPLARKRFETIEVDIRTDLGSPVPFEQGRVIYKMSGQRGGQLSVYRGRSMQRGYGLGDIFRALLRSAVPLLKRGAKIKVEDAGRVPDRQQRPKDGRQRTKDALQGPLLKAERYLKEERDIHPPVAREAPHSEDVPLAISLTKKKKKERDHGSRSSPVVFLHKTSIVDGRWVEYHPVASLAESSPIEFDIPGAGEEFTDLSQTQLYVRAKIVRANGADLAGDAKVGPVNLWLHSLFQQVDVSLGGKLITDATNCYPYRAYLETLLNFGSEAKQTQLTSSLFYQDTPGKLHLVDPYPAGDNPEVNEGLVKRASMIRESRELDLVGPLHVDLFFQDRYLLSKVDVKIKLHRAKHQFSLMSQGGEQYKVVITEASVFLRKVNLLPTYQLSIESRLNKETAKYPLRRIQVKPFTISQGNHTVSNDNLFLGQVPKRVVIALVDNAAFQGSYGTNPYNFQHFNLNHISLCVDGREVPHKALTPNFEQGQYIRSYMNLFGPTGKLGQDCGNLIARDDFDKGYTIYCYDLRPDLCGLGGDHFNVIKQGNLRLELHFAQALERTVVAIVFAEFDNLLEINRQRNVSFDYSN